ncbi:MAG: hypothetical protein M1839_008274 [Geoglossum umbratile]|nr:MAG: hypothetical protein M1839_008274 [Geoglossum umbratile]
MADPLSITASISTILQLSTGVVKLLLCIKHAPGEIKGLAVEVSSTNGILLALKDLVKSGEAGPTTVQSLDMPLKLCQSSLERLTEILRPVDKLTKAGMVKKTLAWPIRKSEVTDILLSIERQKMAFILAFQKDHHGLSRAIEADLAEVKEDVRELRKGQEDKESRDVIAWLSALDFHTKQSDILRRRQEGTGKWLLDADEFKKWLDGTERILWCYGIPGAGKTVLTSVIVDYLERSFAQEDVAIAYIYCSYKRQKVQTDINLIASLLQQLVQKGSSIPKKVLSLYRDRTRKPPTLNEFSKLLQSEIRRFSRVFVIIDALDECTDGDGTRGRFLAELRKLQPDIHLLVTSRHMTIPERDFEEAMRVEIRARDEDVEKHLESRIGRESRLTSYVKRDPSLRGTIISTIVKKARGMFLLAQLHMDTLATKATPKDVRKALETLPKELDGTYREAMKRIENQNVDDKHLAERVLSWISFALEPLTVGELQHALAVEPDEPALDEDNIPDEGLLTSVCAGMVTVDQESNVIRLVHYTTQEYFERIKTSRFPDAQTNIATACLTYISFDVFAEGYCRSSQELEIRLQKYPLLEYAARHWSDHACGEPEEAIKELALRFLSQSSKVMCYAQATHARARHFGDGPYFVKQTTGLHVVASTSLMKVMRLLLERGDVEADSRDEYCWTPLLISARDGNMAAAQLLLECSEVDANSKTNNGLTPLWLAASNGNEVVTRLLLERAGIEAEARNVLGETPLLEAARGGHKAVVRLLLGRGDVDANSEDCDGRTPLLVAAEGGHEAAVRLLLERGDVNTNPKDCNGSTPLTLAAEKGNVSIVRLLLGRSDIEVNPKDKRGYTPLSLAAGEGQGGVVQLLLERVDVEANSEDKRGRTALSWAAGQGKEAVVGLLLGRDDVQANHKDKRGRTALSWAAEKGEEAAVGLLLKRGDVEADSKDKSGRTPLGWAAEQGHKAVVRLLLQSSNVKADSKDGSGRTPLSLATENGHMEVVRLLTPHTSTLARCATAEGRSI